MEKNWGIYAHFYQEKDAALKAYKEAYQLDADPAILAEIKNLKPIWQTKCVGKRNETHRRSPSRLKVYNFRRLFCFPPSQLTRFCTSIFEFTFADGGSHPVRAILE